MNFIQKRILQNKLEREKELKYDCCACIPTIESFINALNGRIEFFMCNKKNINNDDIAHFLQLLKRLDDNYTYFIIQLKEYEASCPDRPSKHPISDLEEKVNYMQQLRKEFRFEFESIYNNFKRITKGLNIPGRNAILTQMRNIFDFDSSKYYAHDQFIIMR
ncbi:MAG: hypothetical protein ACLRFE_01165 [Clostridia bacterium]